ncbi:MAG: hypothetical protein KDH09_12410 [Chrysiogenetes bacterium]|nr:hypothetical protein [Chrysiogenetes bacterium]
MVRMWQIGLIASALTVAFAPSHAFAQAKPKKPAAEAQPKVKKGKDGTLKFNALEIEGERDTPNVIIIQEWTPPTNANIQDEATDELDRVFAGIRSLNRQFDKELKQAADEGAISEEATEKLEERRLREAQQPKPKKRSSKTSLR